MPAPVCQNADYQLKSLDDVKSIDTYLGNASNINWVSQGQPVTYNDALLLTMAQDTVGTLLASTHYVWYGKISAKLTTSQGQGVVTAFIMMSDVKDEIDFEFIGVDIEHAQSNYYSQGVTDCKQCSQPPAALFTLILTNHISHNQTTTNLTSPCPTPSKMCTNTPSTGSRIP